MEPVIAGHPVHPVLIPVPLGLLPGSYIMDILARVTGKPVFAEAAYYNMLIANLGALPAAVTGFLDYREMDQKDPAHQVARIHGIINGNLVLLYTLNLLVRRKNRRSNPGFFLSTLGIAALSISGYLGGELAYGRGWRVRPAERFELEWQKQHKTGPFSTDGQTEKPSEEEYPPEVIRAFREKKSGMEVYKEIEKGA